MTPLATLLCRQIAASGPITVATFMNECLLHPQHGYYTTRQPFGTAGDFTTAPEISQMFGEVIGLALAQAWLDQGAPAAFTLAELGPGRGTLMADILRATAKVPGFHAAARIHLLEASDALRMQQSRALPGHSPQWHASADSLPVDQPLFVVANEFFDALPIRQFQRHDAGWCERMIGCDGGTLAFGLAPPMPYGALDHRMDDTAPDDLVEIRPAASAIMATLASPIAAHGGLALIVDYGDWRSRGDTLQALRNHRSDPPLAHPGQADLTAHVDFEALADAAPALRTRPLIPQGVFLERLGITVRAQALAATLGESALDNHIAAHRRLTHPDEMGHLFKVLVLTHRQAPPPPGVAQ